MEELLKNFQGLLDDYARHRQYIQRARAQGSRFAQDIIEKVVLDHEIKSSTVADQILPLIPDLEAELRRISTEKARIEADKSGADETVQELELRHLIGEMDTPAFEEASADLRRSLEAANGRIQALDAERDVVTAVLDRWVELAREAEQANGLSGTSSHPEPGASTTTPLIPPAPPVKEAPQIDLHEEEQEEMVSWGSNVRVAEPPPREEPPLEERSFEPVTREPRGVHFGTGGREDLSAVLPDPDPDLNPATIEEPALVVMESGLDDDLDEDEEPDDLASEFDIKLDTEDEGGELVHLNPASAGAELGPDLHDDSIDDVVGIAIDIEDIVEDAPLEPVSVGSEELRRALLLYQEGTAEEQIYPFTGDTLTVGRGRDNDIQIKNDSKVSRFHCKLFRRPGNLFYIEDNKSSNGTLVNGELITERRLFGGEEIVIGETFFRFRIM